MPSIVVERTLSSPTAAVWAITKDFGNVGWIPGATESAKLEGSGIGMTRVMQNPEGGVVRETLLALDEEAQSATYAITEGIPFPASSYRATMTVSDDGGKGRINWSCEFEPEGASAADVGKAIEGMYHTMLDWIDEYLKTS
ncbi:MAG: SRPBCC family protein [Deltaproteobacteria bacterium]|jgi:hypothetical protein|nr:SRPBCC family protein [Deltaproteobacteria bacterium]